MGKYLALLVVFFIPLCIVSLYPLIFAQFGDVYLMTSYGSLLAFFIMGAALIAVGTFISSLTENQGFAAGIAIPVILFNYYSVSLAEHISASAMGSVISLCALAVILGLDVYKRQPVALAINPAVGGTALVVTAISNPFLGMLAGIAARVLGL